MVALVERILVTLWVGGMWVVGYVAVPRVFGTLPDSALAGQVAGEMFAMVNVVGVVCGLLLLSIALTRVSGKGVWKSPRVLILTGMLLLLLVEFVVQSMMAGSQAQGLVEGSLAAADYAALHGIASTIYLLMSVLGLLLVWPGPRDYFREG